MAVTLKWSLFFNVKQSFKFGNRHISLANFPEFSLDDETRHYSIECLYVKVTCYTSDQSPLFRTKLTSNLRISSSSDFVLLACPSWSNRRHGVDPSGSFRVAVVSNFRRSS